MYRERGALRIPPLLDVRQSPLYDSPRPLAGDDAASGAPGTRRRAGIGGTMRLAVAAGIAAAAVLLAAGWSPAQENPDVEVTGKVVDAAGKPVARADVADMYAFEGDKIYAFRGATTAEDGTFTITVRPYGRPFALMAYDPERKRAGIVRAGPGAPKAPLVIGLAPAIRIHGKFNCKALGGKPEWTMAYVSTDDGKCRVAQCESREAQFSLLLPDGSWSLNLYGSDINGIDRQVAPKKGKLDLDMGTVEFEAEFLALHYGKPLPSWSVSDARGVSSMVQLADYKGRWVLLEFWGFW